MAIDDSRLIIACTYVNYCYIGASHLPITTSAVQQHSLTYSFEARRYIDVIDFFVTASENSARSVLIWARAEILGLTGPFGTFKFEMKKKKPYAPKIVYLVGNSMRTSNYNG